MHASLRVQASAGTTARPHGPTTHPTPHRSLVFTDPEQTWEGFYNELTNFTNRKRTYGGYVLVLGGDFFCYGCQIVRNYPYGLPIVNVFQIGRDFLVVAGLSVLVGCYHAAWCVCARDGNGKVGGSGAACSHRDW